MKNAFYILLSIALGFVVGYFCQPRAVIEKTETVIDTIFVEKPVPYEVKVVRRDSVPVYITIPADTVFSTRVDSFFVNVPIEIERREYRDSTYRAVVSGAVVGDIHPALEDIDIYSKHTTTTIAVKPPLFAPFVSGAIGKDMVGLGGGVSIRAKHDIGAKVWQVEGKTKVTFEYSYKF